MTFYVDADSGKIFASKLSSPQQPFEESVDQPDPAGGKNLTKYFYSQALYWEKQLGN